MTHTRPQTVDVLKLIGLDGIIVGSVAAGKRTAKDIDLVVKDRGRADRNPVFVRLIATGWPVISEVIGHLVVLAEPLNVELFEYEMPTGNEKKDANRTTYRKAKRRAVMIDYVGVKLLMLRPL